MLLLAISKDMYRQRIFLIQSAVDEGTADQSNTCDRPPVLGRYPLPETTLLHLRVTGLAPTSNIVLKCSNDLPNIIC